MSNGIDYSSRPWPANACRRRSNQSLGGLNSQLSQRHDKLPYCNFVIFQLQFFSCMTLFSQDIVPKHGFLAKPSTLWPNPTLPESGGRMVHTVTNKPPQPGHADVLKPSHERLERPPKVEGEVYGPGEIVMSQQATLDEHDISSDEKNRNGNTKEKSIVSRTTSSAPVSSTSRNLEDDEIERWEPKPPKVLMENSSSIPLELRSQIQMYASTECVEFANLLKPTLITTTI